MRVAIGKIEGVASVSVSLNEGMTTVQFAASHRVRAEEIREVIRANGFSPKEAEVRVAGTLGLRGDSLTLAVPGTDERYVLQGFPGEAIALEALRQLGANARLVLTGQLPASAGRHSVLLVRSYQETR